MLLARGVTCAEFVAVFLSVLLCGHGATCHVDEGYGHDGVELGEDGEDDGVAEEVAVTLGNACDTVGTDLTLTDAREEAGEAAGESCAEDGGRLDGSGFGSEQVEHVLAHVEACEAVEALCAGKGGQHEGITEELAVLLQAADGSVACDGYTISATDAGEADHDSYA